MSLADYIKTQIPLWPNWLTSAMLKLNFFGPLCYGFSYLKYGKTIQRESAEDKLIEMVNFAIKNVPYYRKRYAGLVIRSREEFEEKIGFIDKDIVMANWDDFVADNMESSQCYIETTGGTSGKPMKFLSPKNRYVHSMYFWHKSLKEFGWNYDVMGVIRNHRLPGGRIYMVNPVMKHVIFDGFNKDEQYYLQIWQVLKKRRIRFLYCYPSAAYDFLKFCHSHNLDISFIKTCALTSEAVADYQREFINDVLHIDILISYAHSEKLCQACTVPGRYLYKIEEDHGYMELIDENDNVVTNKDVSGEIVGTTFLNRFFPLIRYRTGDMSSYCDGPGEGRWLKDILGRWNKSMIYRKNCDPISTTALNLHSAFNEHIKGLQYIQYEIGFLTALIVKDDKYTEADHEFIKRHLGNAMCGDENVEIRYVDKLIYQPNGKFVQLISTVIQ